MTSALDRIVIDPNNCFGKHCIRGTRIWVSLILDFLAGCETAEQILEAYPRTVKAKAFELKRRR